MWVNFALISVRLLPVRTRAVPSARGLSAVPLKSSSEVLSGL